MRIKRKVIVTLDAAEPLVTGPFGTSDSIAWERHFKRSIDEFNPRYLDVKAEAHLADEEILSRLAEFKETQDVDLLDGIQIDTSHIRLEWWAFLAYSWLRRKQRVEGSFEEFADQIEDLEVEILDDDLGRVSEPVDAGAAVDAEGKVEAVSST